MVFPSKPKIGPKDKVVAYRCRRQGAEGEAGCDSMNAIVRKVRAGLTQFVCIKCGKVTGVPQGGGINL